MAQLQAIENNPFDAEDEAMFAMFEREGWSHERCLRMGHATSAASLRAAGTYQAVESAETVLALAESWGWRD